MTELPTTKPIVKGWALDHDTLLKIARECGVEITELTEKMIREWIAKNIKE